MRKACVMFCSLLIIYSCNSSGEKAKPKSPQKEKLVPSDTDKELQGWLKGKIWTAEDGAAPMSMLKLKTDGGYELKSDKYPSTWQIIDGRISLARLTEWPIEKVNDTTFRLYVKPTDKWFTYTQTGTTE